VLPGGFSYGDYLRAGAIARFSPIMQAVIAFAKSGGLVWGICNGFQVLCEAHLLPGALLRNEKQQFVGKDVYLRTISRQSPITQGVEKEVLRMPVAHAEGRYYADNNTLQQLEDNGQVLFRYCRKDGSLADDANPNGSINHIAGICNAQRNVFGMMPHPERAAETLLGNDDGRLLFESLVEAVTGRSAVV
jgi:phosphoribosylformylglycinamidine synthase